MVGFGMGLDCGMGSWRHVGYTNSSRASGRLHQDPVGRPETQLEHGAALGLDFHGFGHEVAREHLQSATGLEPVSEPDQPPTHDKPDELLALHGISAELFETLGEWFDVGDRLSLDLEEIDSAVTELGDPVMIAGMAMRKLQALHLISTPGVLTATDVVVGLINDLNRALLQAPAMYLSLRASTTDWDAALAGMPSGINLGGAWQDLADLLAYLQTLPGVD